MSDRRIDRALDLLSVEHHGAISAHRAEDLEVPRGALQRRLAAGELQPLYQGVYRRRGTPEDFLLRVEAARLAVGDGAVAARRTAAALHGLLPHREIEIMTGVSKRCRPEGFKLIRTKFLPDDHVVPVKGIPTTSVPRTLLDLGSVFPLEQVRSIARNAIARGLTTPAVLQSVLRSASAPGRPGSAAARALAREIEVEPDGQLSDSRLEDLMFEVICGAGLRIEPVRQNTIMDEGRQIARVDGEFIELGVVLEADGYEWHSALPEWLRDRRRQNAIVATGRVVLRFTFEDAERPQKFLRDLERTLEARAIQLGMTDLVPIRVRAH